MSDQLQGLPPHRDDTPRGTPSADSLQRLMVDAWPPLERSALGGWLLRAGRGWTLRANSVLAAGEPGLPWADALAVAEGWYAARHLPSAVSVVGGLDLEAYAGGLGAALRRRGYRDRVRTLTLVGDARDVARRAGPARRDLRPELTSALDDEWLATLAAYRRVDEVAARGVLTGSPTQVFARVRASGGVVAIGRLAVAAGWGGLGAMWVHPDRRREGLARGVLATLAEAAGDQDVRDLHLQVDESNTAALGAYESVGFRRHHAYVTLTRP